jgi:hypothetical protein
MMEKFWKEIPVLLCKLEKIFSPRWFNPIQHLLIHHRRLRHKVGNKARVEGCIAEKFKYKETACFTSVYFTEEHNVNAPMMRYHIHQDDPHSDLTIFKW